jgi:hypothetical protein
MTQISEETELCKFYALAYLYKLYQVSPFDIKNYNYVIKNLRASNEEVPPVFCEKAGSLQIVEKLNNLGFTLIQPTGEVSIWDTPSDASPYQLVTLPSFREFSERVDRTDQSNRFSRILTRYKNHKSEASFLAQEKKFLEVICLPEVLAGLRRCVDAQFSTSKSKSPTQSEGSTLEIETESKQLLSYVLSLF